MEKKSINDTDRRNIDITDEILDLVVTECIQYNDLQYSVLMRFFSHRRGHFGKVKLLLIQTTRNQLSIEAFG